MEFTEKLISLVQVHPCLYDYSDKDYKNVIKKAILWERISKEMNQSSDVLKMKWKNLKDGYAKHKRHSKEYTEGQKKTYVNWVWGPHLNFLDGISKPRSSNKNKNVSESSHSAEVSELLASTNENTSLFEEVNTEMYPENESPIDESRLANMGSTWSSRKRRASDDCECGKILEYLKSKEKRDSIDLLLASYAKTLKKMKPKTQASTKIKLAQLFADAELEELQPDNLNPPGPVYSVIYKRDNDSESVYDSNS